MRPCLTATAAKLKLKNNSERTAEHSISQQTDSGEQNVKAIWKSVGQISGKAL